MTEDVRPRTRQTLPGLELTPPGSEPINRIITNDAKLRAYESGAFAPAQAPAQEKSVGLTDSLLEAGGNAFDGVRDGIKKFVGWAKGDDEPSMVSNPMLLGDPKFVMEMAGVMLKHGKTEGLEWLKYGHTIAKENGFKAAQHLLMDDIPGAVAAFNMTGAVKVKEIRASSSVPGDYDIVREDGSTQSVNPLNMTYAAISPEAFTKMLSDRKAAKPVPTEHIAADSLVKDASGKWVVANQDAFDAKGKSGGGSPHALTKLHTDRDALLGALSAEQDPAKRKAIEVKINDINDWIKKGSEFAPPMQMMTPVILPDGKGGFQAVTGGKGAPVAKEIPGAVDPKAVAADEKTDVARKALDGVTLDNGKFILPGGRRANGAETKVFQEYWKDAQRPYQTPEFKAREQKAIAARKGAAPASKSGANSAAPKTGEQRVINGKKARWDGHGWLEVK